MDHRITQCPRCGTSFRVTDAHLAVAAGAVRCGSCLHIFNAREHWLEETPPVAATPEPALTQRDIDDLEIDDDALFDDNTPLFGDEEPPAKTDSSVIFNPMDDDFAVIDDQFNVDDSGPEKISDSFLELNSWEEDTDHSFRATREEGDPTDQADEDEWTRKLLEDDPNDASAASAASAATNAPTRSAIFNEFDDILSDAPEIEDTLNDFQEIEAQPKHIDISEFSPEFLDVDADLSRADPKEKTGPTPVSAAPEIEEIALESMHVEQPSTPAAAERPLFNLEAVAYEPQRLHQFVNESRWPKVLWGIGLAVILLLAIGQYLYFNFTALARGELRPWLTRGCEVVGCVLPPQSDIALIRTNSLIVRSHPSQRGALAVDAIITNQADFPQPYPPLQLQFTDLNGVPVAGRRFSPAEYLSGELIGSRLMPVQQPVHIALELLDPGSRAVNYLLTVVPPDAP